jgi:hypothetical protein
MAKGKKTLIPECKSVLDSLKYEIAAELGLPVGKDMPQQVESNTEFASELGSAATNSVRADYWGHITSRDTGAVGGEITKRLIQRAQEQLFTLS